MNKRTLIAAPLSIIFQDQSLLLLFEDDHKTEIQYTELIIVYLAAKNGSTGGICMPCITEVTADMDGYILIYGAEMDYELHTYKTNKTAGELFIRMAEHAGQGLFGYEPWIGGDTAGVFRRSSSFSKVSLRVCFFRGIII